MKPVRYLTIASREGEFLVRHRKGRIGLDLAPRRVFVDYESASVGCLIKPLSCSTLCCGGL